MLSEGYSPMPGSERTVAPPQDLDKFLVGCYRHFECGGVTGVVSRTVTNFFTVGFVIIFSFILLGLVDWAAVFNACTSEETCAKVSILGGWRWSLWHLLVLGYLLVFLAYLGLLSLSSIATIKEANDLDVFFKLRLGITSDSELRAVAWADIVSRLSDVQRDGPAFCIVQDQLSVVEISNIVHREDHFLLLITSVVSEILDEPDRGDWLLMKCVRMGFFSSSVIWNLKMLISSSLLDDRARLRRELLVGNGAGLAQAFRLFGVVNFVLLIPLLLFSVFYFFLRDAEDLRASRLTPAQRQWTVQALWRLREFGEAPHALNARLEAAALIVEDFISLGGEGGHPVSLQVKKFLKFVAGAFAAVILVIALYHEQALFHLHLFGRNLVWYLGVFGAVVAFTATPVQRRAATSVFALGRLRAAEAVGKLADSLHQLPGLGRFRPSSVFCEPGSRAEFCEQFSFCVDEISKLYAPRASVLLTEILGVIFSPVILGFWLPSISSLLAERLHAHTAHSNLGDWPAGGSLAGGELAALGEGRRAALLREPRAARAAVHAALRFGHEHSPDGAALIDEFGEAHVFSCLEKRRVSLLSHPYLVE